MSQKQIQSSDSTCMSSTDQQLQYHRQSHRNLTGPPIKKKSRDISHEMKTKIKTVRDSTSTTVKTRNGKRKPTRTSKRVTFKGNGDIYQMVEIVNVESYKEYNLDLATSDYHPEDKVKSTCSCVVY